MVNTDPLAGRQMHDVGCDRHRHGGRVLYLSATSTSAGSAAEAAADRKELTYQSLASARTHTHTHIESAGIRNVWSD